MNTQPKVSPQTATVLVFIVLLFSGALGLALYNQMEKPTTQPEEQLDPNEPYDEGNQKFYEVTDPTNATIDSTKITLPQGYFLSTITENSIDDATCKGEVHNPCKIFIVQSDDFAQTYYISSISEVVFSTSKNAILRALDRDVQLAEKGSPISSYSLALLAEEEDTIVGYLPTQIFTEINPKLFVTSAVLSTNIDMNTEQVENFISFVQSLTLSQL